MNKYTKAIELLDAQGKEVIVITPTHVLCLWEQDNSYVMWRWYITVGGNIATESGTYLQSTLYNQSEALEMFHRKCLPYETQHPLDTEVIEYDREFCDFEHGGDLVADMEMLCETIFESHSEIVIKPKEVE